MGQKYTLERSLLQPGDIILTAEKAVVSKGVRLGTASRYSHAAIWVGGTIIESVREGVFSKSAQRLMLDRPSHCAVFRSRVTLENNQIDTICRYARTQVGSLYALDEATLALPRRLMKLEATKKQFCSRLVALAYAEIDYDFINLGSPHYCTPGRLARTKAFVRVPGIVRPALSNEIEFAQSFDPIKKNALDTFEWLAKVRALVAADENLKASFDIQTVNDVGRLLVVHPELDATIVRFLHENDYLTFYNHDVQANPYRYNPDLMTIMLRNAIDPQNFINQEFGKEPIDATRHVESVKNSIQNYLGTRLGFMLEHLKLYTNLLAGVSVRLNHIAIACEAVGMKTDAHRARQLMTSVQGPLEAAKLVINAA